MQFSTSLSFKYCVLLIFRIALEDFLKQGSYGLVVFHCLIQDYHFQLDYCEFVFVQLVELLHKVVDAYKAEKIYFVKFLFELVLEEVGFDGLEIAEILFITL